MQMLVDHVRRGEKLRCAAKSSSVCSSGPVVDDESAPVGIRAKSRAPTREDLSGCHRPRSLRYNARAES